MEATLRLIAENKRQNKIRTASAAAKEASKFSNRGGGTSSLDGIVVAT